MDSGKTGLEQGRNPSRVTHQDRPGWSLGPLPERSISSALNPWPAMWIGVGARQDKAGASRDFWLVRKNERLTMQWFGSFTGQPQSPSSGHTAFPACFGKCMSSTTHCFWGSWGQRPLSDQRATERACPCPDSALQPCWYPQGIPQGGKHREIHSPTLRSTYMPVLMYSSCPLFLDLDLVLSSDRSIQRQQQAPVYQRISHLSLTRRAPFFPFHRQAN